LAAARKAFDQPADELAVVTFDRQPLVMMNFQQWTAAPTGNRASTAIGLLQAQKPGWAGTHLGNAMLRAVELLEEGTDLPTRRQIVVISDFQEGSKLDGLQGFDWPKGVEVETIPLKAAQPGNASLQLVTDTSTAPGPTPAIKIRVANTPDSRRDQFKIRRDGDTAQTDAYIPAGQSRTVSIQLTNAAATNSGPLKFILTGDDQPFDNELFVQPQHQEKVRVLYLGNDEPKDSAGLLYYLLRAFPETRQRQVEVVARRSNQPLIASELQAAGLVVVGAGLSDDQTRTLKAAAEAGTTVLLPFTAAEDTAILGTLLGQVVPQAAEAGGSGFGLFGQIDFQHPLFAPFADARFSDFTRIHFWKFRRLDLSSVPTMRAVAKFDSGEPMLAQIPVGRGTLLVMATTWRPSDSQLALSSKYVPLMSGMLDLGRTRVALATQLTIGETVVLPTNELKGPLAILKPDGQRTELAAGESRFTATDLPGSYGVEGLAEAFRFAVNLNPEESRTTPLGADVLPNLGVPVKGPSLPGVETKPTSQTALAAIELESRQKLWRWLLLAALGVIVLEIWVAGRLSSPKPATA
jgi:hypothetical protein